MKVNLKFFDCIFYIVFYPKCSNHLVMCCGNVYCNTESKKMVLNQSAAGVENPPQTTMLKVEHPLKSSATGFTSNKLILFALTFI